MTAVWIITALVLLLGGALVAGSVVQKRQEAIAQKQQKARQIKHQIDDIHESLTTLRRYDNHTQIQSAVIKFYEKLIKKLATVDSGAFQADKLLAECEQLKIDIEQNRKQKTTILKSDKEINSTRKHFAFIIKILKSLQKQKDLSGPESTDYQRYLKIRLLRLEISAHVRQGNYAAEKNDKITAASYFKHAKELLINFNIPFPEKNEMVKEIAQLNTALYSEVEVNTEKNDASLLGQGLDRQEVEVDEMGFPVDSNATKKKY